MLSNYKISDIKKTKKGFNALFVNGEFLFSVDDLALINYKIKIGSSFNKEELDCISKTAQTKKAVNKCFDYLSRRSHSKKELHTKLLKYYDEETTIKAIEKVEELGYIDDEAFANMMAKHILNGKKSSKTIAKQKLISLGIDKDIIDGVLLQFSEENQIENIKVQLAKKYKNKLEDKQKVVNSLLRKGFKFSDIKEAMKSFEEELDFFEDASFYS